MGGGKSSSSSAQSSTDNKLVVDGVGNLGVGAGAVLDQGKIGMAENVMKGDGNTVNNGTQFGNGTIYSEVGLDDNAYQLIDTAMTLQHATNENFMELTAERDGIDSEKITPLNKSPGANPSSENRAGIGWVVFAVIVVAVMLFGRKKK